MADVFENVCHFLFSITQKTNGHPQMKMSVLFVQAISIAMFSHSLGD